MKIPVILKHLKDKAEKLTEQIRDAQEYILQNPKLTATQLQTPASTITSCYTELHDVERQIELINIAFSQAENGVVEDNA